MPQKNAKNRTKAKKDAPPGMTVSVGQAAKLLDVSKNTLKRRSGEWGLRTFWDKRGRRYSMAELNAIKTGILEPTNPCTMSHEFVSLRGFDTSSGCRFRVYGTGLNKGYLGYFGCGSWSHIPEIIRHRYGEGLYHLKLLDDDGKMTGRNFALRVSAVDDERQAEFDQIQQLKRIARIFKEDT